MRTANEEALAALEHASRELTLQMETEIARGEKELRLTLLFPVLPETLNLGREWRELYAREMLIEVLRNARHESD